MKKKDKKYLAGYLDGKMHLSIDNGKKKRIKLSIPSKSKSIIKLIQSNYGGNVMRHYKSSYRMMLTKTSARDLLREVGPYMLLKRNRVDDFVHALKCVSEQYRVVDMEPVKYINHTNDKDYAQGYMDAKIVYGVFKKKQKNGYEVKLDIIDENKYIKNFFKSVGLKAFHSERNYLGYRYNYLRKAGDGCKPILEYLITTTRMFKELFQAMIDMLNKKDEKNSFLRFQKLKKFIIDESILTTNLGKEERREEKLKRLDIKRRENIKKRLEREKESREAVFRKKEREQKKITDKTKKNYLKAKKEYQKEQQKLKNIQSDHKKCVGTGEILHKDEFNLNSELFDGLCIYSRDYYNEKKKKYWSESGDYMESQRRLNPLERLSDSISTNVYLCLKKKKSNTSVWRYLDFRADHLRTHLEKQFKNGMNWENYGNVWHVDHIKPKAKFDFNKEIDFRRCWTLKNLQPMLAGENLMKSDKYDEEEMKEHERLLNKITL